MGATCCSLCRRCCCCCTGRGEEGRRSEGDGATTEKEKSSEKQQQQHVYYNETFDNIYEDFPVPRSPTPTPPPPPPPPMPERRRHVALRDFESPESNVLSVAEGALVEVLDCDVAAGWWWCRTGGGAGGETERDGFLPTSLVAPIDSVEAQDWYFGTLSRFESSSRLLRNPVGTFLVRDGGVGQEHTHVYTLSVLVAPGEVKNYRVHRSAEGFYIRRGKAYPSVQELLLHYHARDGKQLPVLTQPCAKEVQSDVMSPHPKWAECWKVNPSHLHRVRTLGKGQSGEVWKGVYQERYHVAVKTLHPGLPVEELHREAQIMKTLSHENLLRLYAVCVHEGRVSLITELMRGDLQAFLRSEEGRGLHLCELLHLGAQVSSGMEYLAERGFVHRDLAARNVLVDASLRCCIGDFSLALAHTQSSPMVKIPTRWTAPEGLTGQCFTTKSDVWSFGVLLYEIFTFGRRPYSHIRNNRDVQVAVLSGYRLPQPARCPPPVYATMVECWSECEEARPCFSVLRERLQALLRLEQDNEE
ncbi:tyrosine-protein kinase SRK3-like [Lethenteron reissneri]|uniref:tyrosine-protein kinase SRK3-like n=1 Tax=Lethenteron reissneri TaxID=7753 RepID=UPI002AB7ED65|nr:tyrosine-protein kinase SRK3-like [Lethenteron reissneri]